MAVSLTLNQPGHGGIPLCLGIMLSHSNFLETTGIRFNDIMDRLAIQFSVMLCGTSYE